MKAPSLSGYFEGVAAKRLSAVEIRPTHSNQHEFNGVQGLKRLFGLKKQNFPARFLYLSDDEDELLSVDGSVTWYDSREHHATRTEHRLYYPTTAVSERGREGDL